VRTSRHGPPPVRAPRRSRTPATRPFLLAVPFVLAYWDYTDAERRGEGDTAFWALAVGALTYLTFFGGLLAVVVYIWQRDDPDRKTV
jgi:hypothetical protein